MTPKQFTTLKKTTYTVLALSLGVSVFWLSTGGTMFQASLVEDQTTNSDIAQTYNELENMNENTLHGAAEESTSQIVESESDVNADGISTTNDTTSTSRATISNEMATYRQTMTDYVTATPERTTVTEEVTTIEEVATPETVPTTGPSEILFFLLSMGGALACFLWYKRMDTKNS